MTTDRVYVIAEAGVNHNGRKELAFALVEEAARAGADAVKFQTFNAHLLAADSAPKAAYQRRTTEACDSQRDMLKRLELPHEWHGSLKEHAESQGVEFLSTAFDVDSLSLLLQLDVPRLKVPSGELTNGPLLWRIAQSQKPLLVSAGMATLSEVEQALAVIAHALNAKEEPSSMEEVWRGWSRADWRARLVSQVTLLHCTSEYPTGPGEVNLKAMSTLAAAFHLPVGYSDHTEGTLVPVAAVARGATVIEKHFTLDRTLPGPDHKASLEPAELAAMVRDIRTIELLLGDGFKAPQVGEWDTRTAARQQVIAARPIRSGMVISREDLTTARSGQGLPAMALWDLVGTIARKAYQLGEAVT